MLSIIIINYYSAQLLLDCLHSFEQEAFELIVVDNSPEDGAREKVAASFPSLKWISPGYNAGFARANNAGIKASSGDAVLLLNPDTIIRDNAIDRSYQQLMHSTFAACGIQLLNVDGTPQISGNFIAAGGLNYLMQVPYIGLVLRWLALVAGVSKTNLPNAAAPVTEVDWINGAYLMVKKTAIEKAGMLDEDFFLYHEESEWCGRLKKAGKLCIFGELHAVHLEGQTANKAFESGSSGYSNLSDKKGYQLMLSMFVRIRKEFGLGWFLFHLLFYTICIPFVMAIAVVHSLFSFTGKPLAFAWGFTMNTLKCWRFAGKILGNKPNFYRVL